MSESSTHDNANTIARGSLALSVAAPMFAALPLFHRVGALEIASLIGVAAVSAFATWRARRAAT